MPRGRGPVPQGNMAGTPHRSPVKIPLNDDREEKAKRLHSRQAFHEKQMSSIKAAASPAARKRRSLGAAALADGPNTPRSGGGDAGGSQEDMMGLDVVGTAVTPMKRVPILANFEEWMKMATDNKINAANSWNFALIDYFHDMSLLKEGDGVNFQKASCTLDGCVKIYTSRVDSVATETGKLLSGLADSGAKKKTRDGAEDDDGEDDEEEGEDGVKRRAKKKTRSAEATLVDSFEKLQLKKMELEFSVDPLFKKASADFDEGGAKGLLLNHLSIDNTGRIVFDSSDDAQQQSEDESRRDSMLEEGEEENQEESAEKTLTDEEPEKVVQIDLSGLAARFFPDLNKLDHQDICPSLKTFELGDGSGSLDLPFLKAPEDWRKEKEEDLDDARSGIVLDDDNAAGFDDEDDLGFGGFDMPPDAGFGEGGEAWAKEAHIEPQIRPHDSRPGDDDGGPEDGEVGNFEANSAQFGVTLQHRAIGDDHENILSYFDTAMQKNWAGPEHWKIKKIKDAAKPNTTSAPKRKEKEPFEIDFASPMTQQLADLLYTSASSQSAISLPKTQWKSKTRNLLPDDKHFSSRDLLRLFLKPKARLGSRNSNNNGKQIMAGGAAASSSSAAPLRDGEVDEAYWAQQQNDMQAPPENNEDNVRGDYDADFFQDDGLGVPGGGLDDDDDEDVFVDAQNGLLPPIDPASGTQSSLQDGAAGGNNPFLQAVGGAAPASSQDSAAAFGTQLVTQSRRLRPEYVQYARVAKKVDVRRLKEEMWRGIGLEPPEKISNVDDSNLSLINNTPSKKSAPEKQQQQQQTSQFIVPKTESGQFKFTDVMNNLRNVYPKQQLDDISTSFCFICLLHLANEKGLVIENTEGYQELVVRRDEDAEIVDG